MGIDIYLSWDGQTKEEEEAQYTGFSIEDGHNGYLRAAYWNREGCSIFYDLFDSAKWDDGEPFEYDFKKNYKKMLQLVKSNKQQECWNKSLRDFFDLALRKPNPRIRVSY